MRRVVVVVLARVGLPGPKIRGHGREVALETRGPQDLVDKNTISVRQDALLAAPPRKLPDHLNDLHEDGNALEAVLDLPPSHHVLLAEFCE